MQRIQNSPLTARLLHLIKNLVYGPDARQGLAHLLVVDQLAGQEFGLVLEVLNGLSRHIWCLGILKYLICQYLGPYDVVLNRLRIRLP